MELASLLRPLGAVAGPAAVVGFALMVSAMVVDGEAGVETSPLAVASSAVLVVALLGIGAGAVAALSRLRDEGRSVAGAAVAVVGTVLVAGGAWALLFVLPGLAAEAPDVLDAGLPSVVVGYIASYVVFTVGWLWTGIALLRAGLVPGWLGTLTIVGAALAFVPAPEPFRVLVIGIAVTLLARRLAAPVVARAAVPA
ncbi:hypothetical protein [Blastococcus sp. PRF04-17]|uniref:hypothetical protein n=1 Tax=Blastococcus sp. PRF04-17 TaxID=2933797 RepID=UPI001FF4350E|nr:hypothetical protein [Blastococcus sp. PRF04-17]UOY00434.1 hypothetical protein MVA48_15700 [Blastococcus sp. PRF04-17]